MYNYSFVSSKYLADSRTNIKKDIHFFMGLIHVEAFSYKATKREREREKEREMKE